MGFAISLVADNASSKPIRELWQRVSELEDAPSMTELGYPPHITLAIYDEIDFAEVKQATRHAFSDQDAIALRFERIGYFDNSPLVLWTAPEPSPELQNIFQEIHEMIDPVSCHTHYQPANWVPHCSLGTSIRDDRRTDAIDFAKGSFQPFIVNFDLAETVSFPPVASVEQWPLGSSANPI